LGFNSRPRAGGDPATVVAFHAPRHVSIHAPAQGATTSLPSQGIALQFTPPRRGRREWMPCAFFRISCFNSRPRARPRAGGDRASAESGRVSTEFQFTPPRRGRRESNAHTWRVTVMVSIHAPAQGATAPVLILDDVGVGFNSRPRAGGDNSQDSRYVLTDVSIHAPAQGATSLCRWTPSSIWSFNSRPRAGGDSCPIRCTSTALCFNSRPRAGGDGKVGRHHLPDHLFQFTPPRRGRPA